jgi:hypothetical protein
VGVNVSKMYGSGLVVNFEIALHYGKPLPMPGTIIGRLILTIRE